MSDRTPLLSNPVSNQSLAENFYRFAKMITAPANPDLNNEMTKTSDRFAVAIIVGIVTAGILTIIALIYISCHKNSEVGNYFNGRRPATDLTQREASAERRAALAAAAVIQEQNQTTADPTTTTRRRPQSDAQKAAVQRRLDARIAYNRDSATATHTTDDVTLSPGTLASIHQTAANTAARRRGHDSVTGTRQRPASPPTESKEDPVTTSSSAAATSTGTTTPRRVDIPEISLLRGGRADSSDSSSTGTSADERDDRTLAEVTEQRTQDSLRGRADVMPTTAPAQRRLGPGHIDTDAVVRLATQDTRTTEPTDHQLYQEFAIAGGFGHEVPVDYRNMNDEQRLEAALNASMGVVRQEPVVPQQNIAAAAAAAMDSAFFPLLTAMERTNYRQLEAQHGGNDEATIGTLVQGMFPDHAMTYIAFTTSGMSPTDAFTQMLTDLGRTAVQNAAGGVIAAEIADQDTAYYAALATDRLRARTALENTGATAFNTQVRGFLTRRRFQSERSRITGPTRTIQALVRSRLTQVRKIAAASGKTVAEQQTFNKRMRRNAKRLAVLQKRRKAAPAQPQTQVVETAVAAAAPTTPKLTPQQTRREEQRARALAAVERRGQKRAEVRAAAEAERKAQVTSFLDEVFTDAANLVAQKVDTVTPPEDRETIESASATGHSFSAGERQAIEKAALAHKKYEEEYDQMSSSDDGSDGDL